jgi:predicted GNAT family acetyltransferase
VAPPTLDLTDNAEVSRFEAHLDGVLAAIIEYRRRPGVWVLVHTEVLPAAEGHGIGSAIVRFALDTIRSAQERLVPQCPFVAEYIERHPEDADLVAD